MAQVVGLLGQSDPTAATDTTVYTVPASKRTRLFISFVNRHASTADTIRIALVPSGESLSDEHYIKYEESIAANADDSTSTYLLNSGDFVVVRAANGTMSFTLSGFEDDVPT